jgi:altronate hydrolase
LPRIQDRVNRFRIGRVEHDIAAAGPGVVRRRRVQDKLPGLAGVGRLEQAALAAVYEYAEPVKEKGFVFMDTPGYDPVGATGQVAGGANVMCFTTGRGSAFGCKPTPSVKLATNSQVYASMIDDMDINCGDILDGTPVAQKGEEIFKKVLATASGARTKSEDLGYGDAEFVPWQIGAVM